MTIQNLEAYGANIKEGLTRCMNNEAFYLRMVGMIPGDPNFVKLYDSIAANDLTAAFEAAHALKGTTGNLALTPLFAPISEVTELLRARTEMDYTEFVDTIRKAHDELIAICQN